MRGPHGQELLFSTHDLYGSIRATEQSVSEAVQQYKSDELLSQPEDAIVSWLIERFSSDPPTLRKDEMYVDGPADVAVDVSRRFDSAVFGNRSVRVLGTEVVVSSPTTVSAACSS